MKHLHIIDLTDMKNGFRARTGFTFKEGVGICFHDGGMYHYVVCVKIFRTNGCYSVFSVPIPPESLGLDVVHSFPGIANPTELTWEGTKLRYAFSEQTVTYRWFGIMKSTFVILQAASIW